MTQGQGVVRVARTDELEILVGVPEHRLKAVRKAEAASFELWSDPGHRHAAKLRELSPSADPMTRTYPARFSVIDAAGVHRPRHDRDPRLRAAGRGAGGRGAPVGHLPARHAACRLGRRQGKRHRRRCGRSRSRAGATTRPPSPSGVKDGEMIAIAGVHKLEAGQKVKPVQQAAR